MKKLDIISERVVRLVWDGYGLKCRNGRCVSPEDLLPEELYLDEPKQQRYDVLTDWFVLELDFGKRKRSWKCRAINMGGHAWLQSANSQRVTCWSLLDAIAPPDEDTGWFTVRFRRVK